MCALQRTLFDINEIMFAAENREEGWAAVLDSALADDVVLRRANPTRPDEQKTDIIKAVAEETRTRKLMPDVRVWESGDGTLGVVTCVVEIVTPPPTPAERFFQNVRAFERRDGEWRCVYWQVSGKPAWP